MADPALDEFGRIDRFFKPLAKAAPGALGLTDDAALLPPLAAGQRYVVTVDALVEGIHFLPDDPPGEIAQKSLRVNLSDLAAKAALPTGYLLALALPLDWPAERAEAWLAAFAAGLALDQDRFGCPLYGGDSVATRGPTTISVTAFGSAPDDAVPRRSGARAGDDVWASGTIGDGYLGLLALTGRLPGAGEEARASLARRYRLPEPRLALGLALRRLPTAAMDVSDGLVQDLGHICEASGVGAVVEAASVPLSAAARSVLAAEPGLLTDMLGGGDDYELLFTAPGERRDAILQAAAGSAVAVTRIGRVVDGAGVSVRAADGAPLAVGRGGWRHF